MSVHSWRELPRVATHLIGSSPEFERRFIATLNDPDTNASTVIATVGCAHGTAHPEIAAATSYELEVNEGYEDNRYWVEVIARYRIPDPEDEDADLLPWLRPDIWKFTTQGVAVPALTYIDGTTNKPLVNSAGDYFEGLTVDEAQQKITIQSNRQNFPSALAAAVTNCINDATYAGFATDCVKVQGISGEQVTEVINDETVKYWKITSELLCRQTGWNLLLPDIGFNFIENDERKRTFVVGPDGEQIASSNPIALDGNGQMKNPGELPNILTRRIYKRIPMSDYFGNPPT